MGIRSPGHPGANGFRDPRGRVDSLHWEDSQQIAGLQPLGCKSEAGLLGCQVRKGWLLGIGKSLANLGTRAGLDWLLMGSAVRDQSVSKMCGCI